MGKIRALRANDTRIVENLGKNSFQNEQTGEKVGRGKELIEFIVAFKNFFFFSLDKHHKSLWYN